MSVLGAEQNVTNLAHLKLITPINIVLTGVFKYLGWESNPHGIATTGF